MSIIKDPGSGQGDRKTKFWLPRVSLPSPKKDQRNFPTENIQSESWYIINDKSKKGMSRFESGLCQKNDFRLLQCLHLNFISEPGWMNHVSNNPFLVWISNLVKIFHLWKLKLCLKRFLNYFMKIRIFIERSRI